MNELIKGEIYKNDKDERCIYLGEGMIQKGLRHTTSRAFKSDGYYIAGTIGPCPLFINIDKLPAGISSDTPISEYFMWLTDVWKNTGIIHKSLTPVASLSALNVYKHKVGETTSYVDKAVRKMIFPTSKHDTYTDLGLAPKTNTRVKDGALIVYFKRNEAITL